MKSQSIRHYRVVQRDKDNTAVRPMNNIHKLCEALEKIAILGIIMYSISVILSFCIGFLLGKDQ